MDPFFVWLESTAFSTWMRESPSMFAFPGILALHTIGMAFVVGINGALALRILGAVPDVPMPEMRRFFPMMWAGFWVNLASGVALLVGYPTKALTNPLFYCKLTLIAVAVVLIGPIQREIFRGESAGMFAATPRLRLLAKTSLACWVLAIAAGRFLAYTYTRLFAA